MTLFLILKHLLQCGLKERQLLPMLSIIFTCHLILHCFFVHASTDLDTFVLIPSWPYISLVLLFINFFINITGYFYLYKLWNHSITVIFNREIPKTIYGRIPSLAVHLSMLRPLQILFRLMTARFRVLPDIIILGEVRCGTTTFCHHLVHGGDDKIINGCHPPFCLWKHPELDQKETFYFVGHYLGMVDPSYYSMCFPLKITKWFYTRVLGKPFFTFDGCAQYLTSPTCAYLIAEAYRLRKEPPPILVACVRDPVTQAISWWRYENNAMIWGSQMNLEYWNTDLRSKYYPPKSIKEACEFSSSRQIQELYENAEKIVQAFTKDEQRVIHRGIFSLPSWAITWPGGQLTGIGRNGNFSSNIKRYERVFSNVFPSKSNNSSITPAESKLKYVNVVPLSCGKNSNRRMQEVLIRIMMQVRTRQALLSASSSNLEKMILLKNEQGKGETDQSLAGGDHVHRNAGVKLAQSNMEPTESDLKQLKLIFQEDTNLLYDLCGIQLFENE